ncbi:MFS transporter [Corynebacterium pelargi]|uniref:Sialic acid transporter n=1 Tax=Corynebacterium pelargi TaxID=1471400 RepID=A0A410W965_9CORY|nr:MFS transporter [Corynebacterium pelargi]QAU52492.1 Putative sialic acid transporter [Corynebacterium pelargi]GGG76773.1 putative sialic acid transporter [Corynebacterium pelargi]
MNADRAVPTATAQLPWYKQLSKEKWKAFFAAWLGVLLDGYDFVLISFALPAIRDAFGLSLVQSAALVSAAFISRWLGGLVLGAMADKMGRKPAMVASIILFAAGSILMAFSPGFWLLFICRLIIGFAMAGEYSSSATYIIESWPKHMRNKASGFLLSGFAFGVILAAQVDKYLVAWVESWHPGWGWRALFLTGIVPIVVAIYMRRSLPEADDWEERQQSSDTKHDMLAVLFGGSRRVLNLVLVVLAALFLLLIFSRLVGAAVIVPLSVICAGIFIFFVYQFDPKRWVIGVAIMVTIFASFMYTWPIQGLLPTYLKDVGMDPNTVANVITFAGFGNALGYIIAGFAGDRFGMRRWYAISIIISQTIVFPLFMQNGELVALVAILLFVNQMFGQGISGLLPKWVASYFPIERRAAGLGFCYNVGALGGAVGPVLGAALAGSSLGFGGALAVLSVGFAGIVVLSIGLNLPRMLQKLVDASAVRPEDGNDEIIAKA